MIRVKQVADRCLQNSERGPKPDPLTQRAARGVKVVCFWCTCGHAQGAALSIDTAITSHSLVDRGFSKARPLGCMSIDNKPDRLPAWPMSTHPAARRRVFSRRNVSTHPRQAGNAIAYERF